MDFHAHKPTENVPPQRIALRGQSLLASPRFNKGTAFPRSERDSFGLEGRLPYRVNSLDEQCTRAWEQVQARTTDIAKNTFLQSLKEQNWVLYYALISRHLRALVPIIYTPTEVRIILILNLIHENIVVVIFQADAIANYSHIFRRSEGLFLTLPNEDKVEELFLEQTRGRDIDLFVVTDAEAILGIGDQGVGVSSFILPTRKGVDSEYRVFGCVHAYIHSFQNMQLKFTDRSPLQNLSYIREESSL